MSWDDMDERHPDDNAPFALPRLVVDWTLPPQPPDWLAHRMIVKGQLTLLAALGGGAKTLLSYALAVSVMQGKPFLGRDVRPRTGNVLIVDKEGDASEIVSRLAALGMRDRDRDKLWYVLDPPITLGDRWADEALADILDQHHPDLVIVDSISALAPGDLNSNEVALASMRSLKALRSGGAAVVALAHESKPPREDQTARSRVMNVFGSVQWVNQCDAAIALATKQDSPQPKGKGQVAYPLEWECVRSRAGLVGARGDIEVRSLHGANGERLWMDVMDADSPWTVHAWDFDKTAAERAANQAMGQ